jgi:hypothetical protein
MRIRAAVSAMVGAISIVAPSRASEIEQPRYDVLKRFDSGVEIRAYAPRLAAETIVADTTWRAGENSAFGRLAGYIFGRNRQQTGIAMAVPAAETSAAGRPTKIEMTSPVQSGATARGFLMRFFLPAELTLATAPAPLDPNVQLVELPAETIAVLEFSGFRDPGKVEQMKRALLDRLESSDWRPLETPMAYFYDPPWTPPFLRRNEVAVIVGRRAPAN